MRETVPGLGDGTVALVERLMKKDASQRFTSAAEALAEIERLRLEMRDLRSALATKPVG